MIATLLSEFWPYIIGVAGVLLSVVVTYFKGRKDAGDKMKKKALEKQIKQEARGRDAVAKEQKTTDGMSDDAILDRLRKRGDRWRM